MYVCKVISTLLGGMEKIIGPVPSGGGSRYGVISCQIDIVVASIWLKQSVKLIVSGGVWFQNMPKC